MRLYLSRLINLMGAWVGYFRGQVGRGGSGGGRAERRVWMQYSLTFTIVFRGCFSSLRGRVLFAN